MPPVNSQALLYPNKKEVLISPQVWWLFLHIEDHELGAGSEDSGNRRPGGFLLIGPSGEEARVQCIQESRDP